MSDLQELMNELMLDEEFCREFEAIQPELDITRAMLNTQNKACMTKHSCTGTLAYDKHQQTR